MNAVVAREKIPGVVALHRYFIWANRMRTHFDDLLQSAGATEKVDQIESWLYMSYWYASLYVVIEGWRELDLHDQEIDGLLDSPLVDLLRRYRNGVFHFQREYADDRFFDFIREGEKAVEWVRCLNPAFGRWFLQILSPKKYEAILLVGRAKGVPDAT